MDGSYLRGSGEWLRDKYTMWRGLAEFGIYTLLQHLVFLV